MSSFPCLVRGVSGSDEFTPPLAAVGDRMHEDDGHMTGFRPFFNPATGEWIELTSVAEDSDGQLVRFSRRSASASWPSA